MTDTARRADHSATPKLGGASEFWQKLIEPRAHDLMAAPIRPSLGHVMPAEAATAHRAIRTSAKPPSSLMPKVLYIACSSFSGSTLLSLVLNTHPELATVGHSTGWRFAPDERFLCSCGESLDQCLFWRHVATTFRGRGLPFAYNEFGTRYEIVGGERLNRYLTTRLPILSTGWLERARDGLIRRAPGWSARLARIDRAYLTLVEATLAYNGARVYVDNSHDPFHLRHLRRIDGLNLEAVHLIRDYHGAVYSAMKNKRRDAETATRLWLREQCDIVRVLGETEDRSMTVFYEDICDDTDTTLSAIYDFAGVGPHRFGSDFGTTEHHVLGNMMRLGATKITKDTKWREELEAKDLETIERLVRRFAARHRGSPLVRMIQRYWES